MTVERRLYVEYRLYFNPDANQEIIHELAEQFQEHIYDEWTNTMHAQTLDVKDVTYEIVVELAKKETK